MALTATGMARNCALLVALLLTVVPRAGIAQPGFSPEHIHLSDVVPRSGDVHLAMSDVSSNPAGSGQSNADTNSPAIRKYNPGHYVDLLRYQVFSDPDRYLIPSLRQGVAGVQVRYLWRDLENEPGVYDFSKLEAQLELVAKQQKQLILVVADKTFFKKKQPVPVYLEGHTSPNRKGGYSLHRWNPYVVERWVKLMQALGERFDSHPHFEGVATEESAPGMDDKYLKKSEYTPDKYRDALIEMLKRTAEAMPSSRVFWYMNFLPGQQKYIGEIAEAVAPYGVAMGGPDILPDNSSIKRLTYPFYTQFQGKMPLFCVVMPNSYRHKHAGPSSTKYWTMEELFEFARDELHLNYMLWTYIADPKPADAYDIDDAFPVMERYPVIN